MNHLVGLRWLMPVALVATLQACHSGKSSTAGDKVAASAFTVGGTVSGSTGSVTLACDAGTILVSGNGPFACGGTVEVGEPYTVTVLDAPTAQTCEVTGGSGTVTNANITSVMVTCQQTSFDLTVSVTGLFNDSNLSLSLGHVTQVITQNGDVPVVLNGTVGEQVDLFILAQPQGQLCVLNLSSFEFTPVAAAIGVDCVRDMKFTTASAASAVLGQTDFVTNTQPSAPVPLGQLDAPAGRVTGAPNGMVFVCEYSGNQVSALDPHADTSRDFRLGVDVSQTTSARFGGEDLSTPTAVAASDTQLAVASSAGSRVLLYNSIPIAPVAADIVVGQAGFGSAPVVTCSPNNFVTPTDVTFAGGKLFVADSGCNRVVVFDPVPTANGAGANMVLGQPDFTSYDPNRGFGTAGPGTLNHPGSVWANANTLFVADAYNNRVLVWLSLPTQLGQPADRVLGQTSFLTVTAGVGPNAMSIPYGLVADDYALYVADAVNNRVLIYPLPLPAVGTPEATAVLGQADLTSNGRNAPSQLPGAQNLYQPTGVGFFNATLLVNDGQDFRVLGFMSR